MSYLQIETVQGPLVLDPDRIIGVGLAVGQENVSETETCILVLFVSGGNIDLHISKALADRVINQVKAIIQQRKIRQPSKPVVLEEDK